MLDLTTGYKIADAIASRFTQANNFNQFKIAGKMEAVFAKHPSYNSLYAEYIWHYERKAFTRLFA